MTPLATSYSTTPFSLPPQTTTTSLTYHHKRPIFSLSDGVLRRPVELAAQKRTSAASACPIRASRCTGETESADTLRDAVSCSPSAPRRIASLLNPQLSSTISEATPTFREVSS